MGPDSKEDDDWTKYADTGYTSSYDPWADMVPATELEEEEFEDEFDEFDDIQSTPRDIPRCPAPSGIEHAIRIGTCNHCLGLLQAFELPEILCNSLGKEFARKHLSETPI